MFLIQGVVATPNPNALKFVLDKQLLKLETRHYETAESANNDLFAKKIFELEGVTSVFYMDKFVTIEKNPDKDWNDIQRNFAKLLSSLDESTVPEENTSENNLTETELLTKITRIIDTQVRPALAADGGGLEIISLDGLTLSIRYQGACGSCPSAIRGTLVAIENLLKREINPEITVIPG